MFATSGRPCATIARRIADPVVEVCRDEQHVGMCRRDATDQTVRVEPDGVVREPARVGQPHLVDRAHGAGADRLTVGIPNVEDAEPQRGRRVSEHRRELPGDERNGVPAEDLAVGSYPEEQGAPVARWRHGTDRARLPEQHPSPSRLRGRRLRDRRAVAPEHVPHAIVRERVDRARGLVAARHVDRLQGHRRTVDATARIDQIHRRLHATELVTASRPLRAGERIDGADPRSVPVSVPRVRMCTHSPAGGARPPSERGCESSDRRQDVGEGVGRGRCGPAAGRPPLPREDEAGAEIYPEHPSAYSGTCTAANSAAEPTIAVARPHRSSVP